MLLFVAGAPDPGDERPRPMPFWSRMMSGVAPGYPFAPSGLREGEVEPGAWHLPGDMQIAVDTVHEEATRRHLSVRVIDVNRPGPDRELVEKYVGSEDLLPLLVRSDNGRLDGLENFTPGAVRRFLSQL